MKRHYGIAGIFLIIIFLAAMLLLVSPVGGMPPLQGNETERAQTIDAFVNQGSMATQTAMAADLYATANALYGPTATPAPATGLDPNLYQAAKRLGDGWNAYYAGQDRQAIDDFEEVIRLAPDWSEGYVGKAMGYIAIDSIIPALLDFEKAVALDDNDADLFAGWYGYTLDEAYRFQDAVDACTRAVELNPYYSTGYHNRAYAYEQLGRYDQAIEDYTMSILLDPADPIPYSNLANVYRTLEEWSLSLLDGDIGDALDSYEDGIPSDAVGTLTHAIINAEDNWEPIDPHFIALAHYNLGLVHVTLENYDLAHDEFDAAKDLFPEFAAPQTELAKLYLADGNTQAAFETFNRALIIDPNYAGGYLARARAYDAVGEHERAVADYWNWVRLNQGRDIPWLYYLPGESFTLGVEETWVYTLPLKAVAGQAISITASAPTGSFKPVDPVIVVLGPSGQPIAAGAGGETESAFLSMVAPVEGSYTIAISHAEQFSGVLDVTVTLGPVLTAQEMTATVAAYTPTYTPTFTPTPLPPTVTPTATMTFTPTATLIPASVNFNAFRQYEPELLTGVAWQDDDHLIVSYFEGTMRMAVEESGMRHSWLVNPIEFTSAIGVSPDGKVLAFGEDDIYLYDAEAGTRLNVLQGHANYLQTLVFNADHSLLASTGTDSLFIVWNTATGEPVLESRDPVFSVAFSSVGKWMATTDISHEVILWSVADPANIQQFTTLDRGGESGFDTKTALAFSPNGKLLAAVSNNDIVLWNMDTFTQIGRLQGHTASINGIAFSPDGSLLVSGGDDRTVRLWSIASLSQIANFMDGSSVRYQPVLSVSFNPSGTRILSWHDNYQFLVWENGLAQEQVVSSPPSTNSGAHDQAVQQWQSGWSYYFVDDVNNAIEAFSQVIDLDPQWVEGYMGRAAAELDQDDSATIADLSEVLALEPDDPYSLSWRGALYINDGQIDAAIADLEHNVEVDPDNAYWAYDNLGYIHASRGETSEALEDYNTAIRLAPYNSTYFDDRANLYDTMGMSEEALVDRLLRDGLAAADNGDYDAAIRYYTRVINDPSVGKQVDPLLYAYYNLSLTYFDQGMYDQAIKVGQNAVDLDPEYALAVGWLGRLYAVNGDAKMSLKQINQALVLNPDQDVFYRYRALTYDALDRHTEAIPDYWAWVYMHSMHQVLWPTFTPGQSFPLAMRTGWYYRISVTGQAGQTLTASLSDVKDVPGDPDLLLILLDPDGQPIAANDDANADTTDALLSDIVLPTSGDYTLIVACSYYEDGMVNVQIDQSAK